MSLLIRVTIIIWCFTSISCVNYYGLRGKINWNYYKKMGGTEPWKVYRREWANNFVGDIKFYNKYLKVYNFRENEKVASVGTSMGVRELVYAKHAPKLNFYLEDIDTKKLNEQIFQDLQKKINTLYPHETDTKFKIVIGDEQATHLPDGFFDKIILEKTLHELKYPDEMLKDIAQKLTDKGSLYITENVVERVKKRVVGCRYLTEAQLILLLRKNNFQLINKHDLNPPFENFYSFEFKKLRKE